MPIVLGLDHHANVTQQMVDDSHAIVGHRTQPHDPFDTGVIGAALLLRMIRTKPAAGDGVAQDPAGDRIRSSS